VLKDFGAIGKFMTGLSRHFGPVERYSRFVRSAALAEAAPALPQRRLGPLVLRARSLAGTPGPLVMPPGSAAAVLTRDRRPALGVLLMDHAETEGQRLGPVAWIDGEILLEDAPLLANLAWPGELDAAEIEAEAATFAPPDDPVPYRPGWSHRPLPQLPAPPPEWLVCALKVVVASRRGACCLAIRGEVLQALPEAWREACRRSFTGGPLLVLHRDVRSLGQAGETAALLVGGGQIIGWLPVTADNHKELAAQLRRMVERTRAGGGGGEPLEEEELAEEG
jgi:hypothetical protein